MAAEYVRASTQYHATSRLDHRVAGQYGFTISAWFRPDDTTASAVVSLCTSGGTARHQVVHASAGSAMAAASFTSGGTSVVALTTNTATTGAWNHAFCRFGSAVLRAAMLNGNVSGAAINTTSNASASHDRLLIGARIHAGTAGGSFDGGTAHVAVWSNYLSLNDGVMLARGANPMSIQPDALIYYFPMPEGGAPLVDLVLGERASPTNSPALALYTGRTVDAPPRRSARIYTFGQPAAGGGSTIPVFRHHYVQQGVA